ncbi:MAG: MASE1 domain-containing protein, partial [Chloroflexi bacterium]|nr:MASE1 domain-containing protein [Chloroflexota bacterium]
MNRKSVSHVIINLIKVLLVAALYYLTAQLGLLTMLSSIGIPALWAPSGLAQAAVLIWGWPAGLGIFIGALLVFLGIAKTLTVAVALACGGLGQAVLAAWLLKRYVHPMPPETIRSTLLTLGISATAALLAPLLAVAGRCYSGVLPWSEFASQAWLWWLSGMVGILLFTPGLVYLSVRLRKKQVKETLIWMLTSLVIGVTLSSVLVLSNFERQNEREVLDRGT